MICVKISPTCCSNMSVSPVHNATSRHSMVTEASHVLQAMSIDASLALNATRVSFGIDNSLQDVDSLFAKLQELVNKLPAVFRQAAV